MAEVKQFVDYAGLSEFLKGVKGITVSPEVLATTLSEYMKGTEITSAIEAAIAASEKKIFGDGELAEAFDTIKEIGDYLKDHDSVAAGLTAEIGKKVDKETYNSDQEALKGRVSQNESDIAALKEALGTEDGGEGESVIDRIEDLEENKLGKAEASSTYQTIEGMADYETQAEAEGKYVQIENLQAIPTATIQAMFNA